MAGRRQSNESTGTPPRIGLQGQHSLSWTDDLPVCQQSGVGFSTNQIYRLDGNRREDHDFEDRSFHFSDSGTGCYLYGVFDGHDGSKASNFAAQRMPAELLLGQLAGEKTDEEIKEVLHQAFIAVEKGFFESMDDLLAEKTTAQLQLPEGLNAYEACQKYPDIVNKLQTLGNELSGGTTAVVALIYRNKLYVANVGDSRALLCKTDEQGVLRVSQLSTDHTIASEEEQIRLVQLGLDVEKLTQMRKIGNSDNTRCIGDYHVKGGYKDMEILCSAVRDPVIAEPAVNMVPLDQNVRFLVLMSDGLYHALEAATGTDRVNADIVTMILTEFAMQSTLNGVAQAVVDKVVRRHHDTFMTAVGEQQQRCQTRGDITLLVRNFNQPLPNSISSPTGGGKLYPVSVPYYQPRFNNVPSVRMPANGTTPLHVNIPDSPVSGTPTPQTPQTPQGPQLLKADVTLQTNDSGSSQATGRSLNTTQTNTNASTNSTQSSGESRLFAHRQSMKNKLELDSDGKVEAYVDFSDFYKAMEQLSEGDRDALDKEMQPQSSYEPIVEEVESPSNDQETAEPPLSVAS